MNGRLKTVLPPFLIAVGIAVVIVDQATKGLVFAYLSQRPYVSIEILGEWLRLSYTTNTGSAFGLFQDQRWLHYGASILVIPAIFYLYRSVAHEPWPIRLSLGLLLGGTLGNLIDRVRLGYVIDFVDVGIGSLRWPSFNVADSSFVVGTTILIVYLLFLQREQPCRQPTEDSAPRA